MRTRRPVRRLATVTVAAALLMTACATDDADSSGTTDAGTEAGAPWPMTGLPSEAGDDVEAPVVVVKVDNVAAALPQTGIGQADIVVEEPVEGGVTRLAVFVHSDVSAVTGPVRSVRSSDVGIVAPASGVLVASGGAPEALADLESAGVPTVLDGTAGFGRDSARAAPHNLFVDLAEAYGPIAAEAAGPEGPFFDFGDPAVLAESDASVPAGDLTLTFSPAQTTQLVLDGDTWSRALPEPDGFTADTVIALLVEQGTADYRDPSGAPVPINLTEGTGQGWMAHAGRVVELEWSKTDVDDPWTFSVDGEPLPVPAGTTYLALMSERTGSLETDGSAEPTPGA